MVESLEFWRPWAPDPWANAHCAACTYVCRTGVAWWHESRAVDCRACWSNQPQTRVERRLAGEPGYLDEPKPRACTATGLHACVTGHWCDHGRQDAACTTTAKGPAGVMHAMQCMHRDLREQAAREQASNKNGQVVFLLCTRPRTDMGHAVLAVSPSGSCYFQSRHPLIL
jgi:hypothetical protein